MLYILEGADGTGKTTLATSIKQNLQNISTLETKIVHFGAPGPQDTRESIMDAYEDVMNLSDTKNIIMDRSWFSEPVYAAVKNRDKLLTIRDISNLSLQALEHNAIFIYCSGSFKEIRKRLKERGEDYIKTDAELLSVIDGYDKVFGNFKMLCDVYHFSPVFLKYSIDTFEFN